MLLLFVSIGLFGAGSVQGAPIVGTLNTNTSRYFVNVANNNEFFFGNNLFQSDSLAQSPAGTLYSIDAAGVIWDVTAGPFPAGPTARTQVGDLVYGNGGLWGFSNATQELFFFDLGSSTVTSSQVISGTGTNTITGVAYQPSTGDVYLSGYIGLNTDKLFRVPNASNTATLVGSMANADPASYFSDIEFDSTGTLYAMSWFHRWFYTVSTTTALTTLVSTGPHRDVTAMAFAVPEHASWLGLAWGALLIRNRRGKAARVR
jgi:hypothetical protein